MLVSTYHISDAARANARRQWVDARPIVIGSASNCHVVLEDPEVAPCHLQIFVRDGAIVVENLASTADVDGMPLAARQTVIVDEGRPIRIGGTVVKIRAQPAQTETPGSERAPSRPSAPIVGRPSTRLRPPKPVLSDDPTEQNLLVTLRVNPGDQTTRTVYADWLAQRGLTAKAELVRLREHLDTYVHKSAGEIEWRAVVVCTPIEHCIRNRCPEFWDALAPGPDDFSRHCARCGKRVVFCGELNDVRAAAFDGQPCVFDAALDRVAAHEAYRRFGEQPMLQVDDDDDLDDDPDGYTLDTSNDRR